MKPVAPNRIVVLGQPRVARQVQAFLSNSRYEIYRTPDAAGVVALVSRVRPHLIIIVQDIPWANVTETSRHLAEHYPRVPVLLISDADDEDGAFRIPRLSSLFDERSLQIMVAELLGVPEAQHDPG